VDVGRDAGGVVERASAHEAELGPPVLAEHGDLAGRAAEDHLRRAVVARRVPVLRRAVERVPVLRRAVVERRVPVLRLRVPVERRAVVARRVPVLRLRVPVERRAVERVPVLRRAVERVPVERRVPVLRLRVPVERERVPVLRLRVPVERELVERRVPPERERELVLLDLVPEARRAPVDLERLVERRVPVERARDVPSEPPDVSVACDVSSAIGEVPPPVDCREPASLFKVDRSAPSSDAIGCLSTPSSLIWFSLIQTSLRLGRLGLRLRPLRLPGLRALLVDGARGNLLRTLGRATLFLLALRDVLVLAFPLGRPRLLRHTWHLLASTSSGKSPFLQI
jgi:hypothetical protein